MSIAKSCGIAALVLAAGTASADTAHSGCDPYGAFVSVTAQSLNGPETPGAGGAFVSGIATGGAGGVAETVFVLKQLSC